jgi:hypothetical protein
MKRVCREIGNGVQIVLEPPSALDPDQKSIRMHLADSNYGVIWYPNKKKLEKLHKILGDFIQTMN